MILSKVPLCGWLWLLTLYSTVKPSFAGDPRLHYDPHISIPDRPRATSIVGVPTPNVYNPSDPLHNPPTPPLSSSPRATIYIKPQGTRPTSVAMSVFNPTKSAPQNHISLSVRFIISYVRRGVLQVFEQLTRPPVELSIGLVTTRSGNKLSAPPWALKMPRLPPFISPTLTVYVHLAHTPTLDPSSPATPTSGHGSRRGDPFSSITRNPHGLGCWTLILVISALTVVRRVLPLSHQVAKSTEYDEPVSAPPALTALDWAPVMDSVFRYCGDAWFYELAKQVSIETKLAAHITVAGHRRRPLFYRANRTLFERHLISRHLETVMHWTLGEARRAAGNMDWYYEARELGATVDICVQVKTAEFIINKNEDQTAFINGRYHLQRSYCLSFELAPNTPETPSPALDTTDLGWFLKGIDGRPEDHAPRDIQDDILTDFLPPLAHPSPILAGCQARSFSTSSLYSQHPASHPHSPQVPAPSSQGISPPGDEELSISLSTGSFAPPSCSSPRIPSRVLKSNPSPESSEARLTTEVVFDVETVDFPRPHLDDTGFDVSNDEPAASLTSPLHPLPPHLTRLPPVRGGTSSTLPSLGEYYDPRVEPLPSSTPASPPSDDQAPLESLPDGYNLPPPRSSLLTKRPNKRVLERSRKGYLPTVEVALSLPGLPVEPEIVPVRRQLCRRESAPGTRLDYRDGEHQPALDRKPRPLIIRKTMSTARRFYQRERKHWRNEEDREERRYMKKVMAARSRGEVDVFKGRGGDIGESDAWKWALETVREGGWLEDRVA